MTAFNKTDEYIVFVTVLVCLAVFGVIRLATKRTLNVEILENLASLFNTKGGIIILLTFMWFCTLGATVTICVWAIIHGVDPQNGILVLLLGVLTSGAWGNVNGAWLKTMTGEEPSKRTNGNGAPTPPQTPPVAPAVKGQL